MRLAQVLVPIEKVRLRGGELEALGLGSWVLTQGARRGAHGPNEPRSITKLAGCDVDGSREEGGKDPPDPLIQLGTHPDASPEYNELQIEERLQCHYGEGHPARRRVEDRRRHFISFLQ
jgi:hypothetical protein